MKIFKNNRVIIFILIVMLVFIGAGLFYYENRKTQSIVCAQDAKLCPDGSYVLRGEPKCKFASCPTSKNISTPTPTIIKINPATGWKIYESEDYSFEYPPKFYLFGTYLADSRNTYEDLMDNKILSKEKLMIYIEGSDSSSTDPQDYLDFLFKKPYSFKEIKIANKNAVRVVKDNSIHYVIPHTPVEVYYRTLHLSARPADSNKIEIFEKIVSSLKFTY